MNVLCTVSLPLNFLESEHFSVVKNLDISLKKTFIYFCLQKVNFFFFFFSKSKLKFLAVLGLSCDMQDL